MTDTNVVKAKGRLVIATDRKTTSIETEEIRVNQRADEKIWPAQPDIAAIRPAEVVGPPDLSYLPTEEAPARLENEITRGGKKWPNKDK